MKRLLLISLLLSISNCLNAQGWGQTQKIVPNDRALGDSFGWAIAMQNDIAAVGAKDKNIVSSLEGAVYMYHKDGNSIWSQSQKLINSDQRQFDFFGSSIDIDGDFMIVGARGQDYDESNTNFENAAGAAYIFENNGMGNWTQTQKIVASDRGETFQPGFGETVAISGNYAVINAPLEDTGLDGQPTLEDAGACYIFERDTNGIWIEVQKIVSSDRDANERWGEYTIDISGNTILVGSIRENLDVSGGNELENAGAVYVFERDTNGIWNETQKIVNSDRELGDTFGRSVSIDGNFLIVGADYEDINGNASGAAYMFEKDGTGIWNEVQKITSASGVAESRFGQRVAIEGDRIVIGAWVRDVGSATDGGAAYIFEKDGTGFWNETAIMYDPNASNSDYFGFSVAISGDYCFVAANQENEDENNENTLQDAGSAFIFNVDEPNTLPPLNTLSVVENDFNANIKVFPNPTHGALNIDLKTSYDSVEVIVVNILGQEVFKQAYDSTTQLNLNFKDLQKGIYMVNLKLNQSTKHVLKIIKN